MNRCETRGEHEFVLRESAVPDVKEFICTVCDEYRIERTPEAYLLTPKVLQFFKENPGEDVAFPCGHDDICGYVMTRAEVTQRVRPETRLESATACPSCGSNVDRERYARRENIDLFVELKAGLSV